MRLLTSQYPSVITNIVKRFPIVSGLSIAHTWKYYTFRDISFYGVKFSSIRRRWRTIDNSLFFYLARREAFPCSRTIILSYRGFPGTLSLPSAIKMVMGFTILFPDHYWNILFLIEFVQLENTFLHERRCIASTSYRVVWSFSSRSWQHAGKVSCCIFRDTAYVRRAEQLRHGKHTYSQSTTRCIVAPIN